MQKQFLRFAREVAGFTLIEMLIVIVVIVILSSAILVGLPSIQRGARDSRRLSDLRQVQNGLELYFSKCGYYPGNAQPGTPCSAFAGSAGDWTALAAALAGSNIGVNKVPNDPTSGRNYFYAASLNGSSYVIGAQLEDGNNSSLTNGDDADNADLKFSTGFSCDDPVYCIQF